MTEQEIPMVPILMSDLNGREVMGVMGGTQVFNLREARIAQKSTFGPTPITLISSPPTTIMINLSGGSYVLATPDRHAIMPWTDPQGARFMTADDTPLATVYLWGGWTWHTSDNRAYRTDALGRGLFLWACGGWQEVKAWDRFRLPADRADAIAKLATIEDVHAGSLAPATLPEHPHDCPDPATLARQIAAIL